MGVLVLLVKQPDAPRASIEIEFTDPAAMTFALVVERATRHLNSAASSISLKYIDSDGDAVTIASDADLKEALAFMEDEGSDRLVVHVAAGNDLPTHLRGFVAAMTAFVKQLDTATESEAMTIKDLFAMLHRLVTEWEVAEDVETLVMLKSDLVSMLTNDELVALVESLHGTEPCGKLVTSLLAAVEAGEPIDSFILNQWDDAVKFAHQVVKFCPVGIRTLLIRVAKSCAAGLVALSTEAQTSVEGMPALMHVEDVKEEAPFPPECELPKVVHTDYRCDVCQTLPIVGPRYRSKDVANFDLCQECYTSDMAPGNYEEISMYLPVHFGIACDGCDMSPLAGVRYKSFSVHDFDLCEKCEASGKWATHEPFIKITHPRHAPGRIQVVDVKLGEVPSVHSFVACDGCDVTPIIGKRFKSASVDNIDLCEHCHASGAWNTTHGPFGMIDKAGDMRKFRKLQRAVARGHDVDGRSSHNDHGHHHGHRHPHHHHGHHGHHSHHRHPHHRHHHHRHHGHDGHHGKPDHHSHHDGHHRHHGHHGHHHGDHARERGDEISRCPGFFGRGLPPLSIPPIPAPLVSLPSISAPVVSIPPMPAPAEVVLSASFEHDVTIPDGTLVAPETELVKAWMVKNNGKVAWPEGCTLKMQTGRFGFTPFDGDFNLMNVVVPALAPGEKWIVEVQLRAPVLPGRYNAYWRICDPSGASFGHRFWIDVIVSEDLIIPEAVPEIDTTAVEGVVSVTTDAMIVAEEVQQEVNVAGLVDNAASEISTVELDDGESSVSGMSSFCDVGSGASDDMGSVDDYSSDDDDVESVSSAASSTSSDSSDSSESDSEIEERSTESVEGTSVSATDVDPLEVDTSEEPNDGGENPKEDGVEPKDDIVEELYEEALNVLAAMGFGNQAQNRAVLAELGGNLMDAINNLLVE